MRSLSPVRQDWVTSSLCHVWFRGQKWRAEIGKCDVSRLASRRVVFLTASRRYSRCVTWRFPLYNIGACCVKGRLISTLRVFPLRHCGEGRDVDMIGLTKKKDGAPVDAPPNMCLFRIESFCLDWLPVCCFPSSLLLSF